MTRRLATRSAMNCWTNCWPRWKTAKADESVRVVVLTLLHERVFSSGGNLKAFADDGC